MNVQRNVLFFWLKFPEWIDFGMTLVEDFNGFVENKEICEGKLNIF